MPVTASTFAEVAADLLRREFADPAGRIFARAEDPARRHPTVAALAADFAATAGRLRC